VLLHVNVIWYRMFGGLVMRLGLIVKEIKKEVVEVIQIDKGDRLNIVESSITR